MRESRIKEIDGLRALALVSVLLFHLKVQHFFSGGFLGVDIFFVISGYVVTLSLLRQKQNGTFSIRTFLLKRIIRLIPSLLCVLLLSNIFVTFLFTKANRKEASRLSFSALFSFSNIHLWLQSNYFDTRAQLKPFLHTWSLGVEWQFYITWSILVKYMYDSKLLRRHCFAIMYFLSVSSLLAAEFTRSRFPSATFYLPMFRYFEFTYGAILAWKKTEKEHVSFTSNSTDGNNSNLNNVVSLFSFATLIVLVLLFRETMPFPGLTAIPICIATGEVIQKSSETLVGSLLLTPLMQWLGKISYSVYLTHWPIQVFIDYYFFSRPTIIDKVYGVFVSILLGHALFHLVERPFALSKVSKSTRSFKLLGIFTCVLFLQIYIMQKRDLRLQNNSQFRSEAVLNIINNTRVLSWARGEEMRPQCRSKGTKDNLKNFKICNPPSEKELVLIGDSHALDLWYAMNKTFYPNTVISIAGTGCSLFMNHHNRTGCAKLHYGYPNLLEKRRNRIRACILISRWVNLREKDLENSFLAKSINFCKDNTNAKIFILGPRPEFLPHPNEVFQRFISNDIDELERRAQQFVSYDKKSEAVLRNYSKKKNVNFINVAEFMCDNRTKDSNPEFMNCPLLSEDRESLIMVDNSHYNRIGAQKVVDKIEKRIMSLLS